MRLGRPGGTGGPGLAVPMAWLCAEYTAGEILRAAGLVGPGTIEFRAGHRCLALTIHLSGRAGLPSPAAAGPWPDERIDAGIDGWIEHTAHGRPWPLWVARELADRAGHERDGAPDPDLALAVAAWEWLRTTEVHAADLDGLTPLTPGVPPVDEGQRVWTPVRHLGLPLAHLALHLW
ncbi:hypothetical protein [Streptomyces sp. NPDC005805]|uniref:hypothetical protein n=1 Tax=Streptomyces sp. NPDC005805 TaxID=3157068 RepID=UPI0033EF6498